jgi:hypothetical protein
MGVLMDKIEATRSMGEAQKRPGWDNQRTLYPTLSWLHVQKPEGWLF